jgi:hypothetical protein
MRRLSNQVITEVNAANEAARRGQPMPPYRGRPQAPPAAGEPDINTMSPSQLDAERQRLEAEIRRRTRSRP